MEAYPINYSNIKDEKKASVALAATMFVSELAYEVAVRWVPILREDRTIFNRDLRHRLRKFETSVKQYNSWLTYATGSAKNMGYIRFISDELNCYADDELHKLMLSTKNIYDRCGCEHSMTMSRLDTLYYMFLLANINAQANMAHLKTCIPRPQRFEPMGMEPQMRILEGIRMTAFDRYADGVTISEDEEMNIERSIKAIVEQLMKHSNDVCGMVDVELPEEIGK